MADIIKMSDYSLTEEINETALMEITDGLLFDARTDIVKQSSLVFRL